MVIAEGQPGDPTLPVELQDALREWAAFAAAVTRAGQPEELELLSRRGRQLASRVVEVLGRPVNFVDPVTGTVEPIRVGVTGLIPRPAAEPPGPTPWVTGLPVSAFFGVFAAIADIVLSRAFAEAFGLIWVPANLIVILGLAPSVYLLRNRPFWRWPVLGVAAGLGAAWVVLLLDLLGR